MKIMLREGKEERQNICKLAKYNERKETLGRWVEAINKSFMEVWKERRDAQVVALSSPPPPLY